MFLRKLRVWKVPFMLVLALALILGGCSGGGNNTVNTGMNQPASGTDQTTKNEAIKIGVILPLTGSEAMFGEMEKNAMLLAYEELEQAGKTTIDGKKIELLFEDDQSKQDSAKAAAEKLINQDRVAMLSGGYASSNTNVIASTAQAMKVPFLIITGSADDITRQGWNYVFRGTAAPASKYTGAMWDFMDTVVKPKTAAVIYENTDFGTSSAKGFRESAASRGIEIVYDQSYEKGALDFKPILSNMKKKDPDIIFAVSYVMDAALIVKQMKEVDLNPKLFIGGAAGYTMPEFKENAGSASEYISSTTLWVPNVAWKGAKEFYENYKEKYSKEADYHGAQAYASMYLIADALSRAASADRDAIQLALKETKLDTIMGPIAFEDWDGYTNQNKPTTYVVQWQEGKLEVIWPEDAASKSYVYPVPTWKER
ncbi:MAG: ABC transporter substrate-binding protein [Candidatus Carbobacillus altaicus]|nr:ABC transporter substrate-binding protein [Candidatus Carbobacillus altaicus]